MTIHKILLSNIHPNPWQTRTQEDPELVERMADSIKAEGLLQVPLGRRDPEDPDAVQLAFGHTRRAAFAYLAATDDIFKIMPVDLRKLSDERLAELAIRENIERQDLTPIDEARAMKRLMSDFDKSTADVAEIFGLKSASSVRTKLRLLSLPPRIQSLVDTGDLAERDARRFITVSRIDPERAVAIADEYKGKKKVDAEEIVEEIESVYEDTMECISSRWEDGSVKSLFHITTNVRKALEPDPLTAAIAIQDLVEDRKIAKEIWTDGWLDDKIVPSDDIADRFEHLVNPPTCASCSYSARISGSTYCALPACLKTKVKYFKTRELEKAMRACPGIPAYSKKDDGPADDGRKYDSPITMESIVESYNAESSDVRLKLRGTSAPRWNLPDYPTKSAWVDLVMIGKKAQAVVDKDVDEDDERDARQEKLRKDKHWRREIAQRIVQSAGPHFGGQLFAETGIHGLILVGRILAGGWELQGAFEELETVEEYRSRFGEIIVSEEILDWDMMNVDEPSKWIKYVEGVATERGVKLPQGWDARADAVITIGADRFDEVEDVDEGMIERVT